MNLSLLASFLDGGRVVLCLIIALFFLRMGRASGDRLYAAFAAAFGLLALSSLLIGLGLATGDWSAYAFMPRLVAFLLISWAIVDKNRRAPKE